MRELTRRTTVCVEFGTETFPLADDFFADNGFHNKTLIVVSPQLSFSALVLRFAPRRMLNDETYAFSVENVLKCFSSFYLTKIDQC